MILKSARQANLAYSGDRSPDEFLGNLRYDTGLSAGRIMSLTNMVEGIGVRVIRTSTDQQLRAIFKQSLTPFANKGVMTSAVGGLTHTSIVPNVRERSPVFEADPQGKLNISKNGLGAVRSIAAFFQDIEVPDLNQIRSDLVLARQQLREISEVMRACATHDRPAIGHNNPPPHLQIEWSEGDVDEALASLAIAESELNKPNAIDRANPDILVEVGLTLKAVSGRIAKWIFNLGKLVGKGIITEIGKEAWQDPEKLASKIEHIGSAILSWAEYITSRH